MALTRVAEGRRIEDVRQLLELQKCAKRVAAEAIGDSQEVLQAKIVAMGEKLDGIQDVAVRLRDEVLACEEDQRDAGTDVAEMKVEIARLMRECEALLRAADEGQAALGESLQDMNPQRQAVVSDVGMARKWIEQYDEELVEQDGKIELLGKELALSRHRYKIALKVFGDNEET
jgi:hypothetical protein